MYLNKVCQGLFETTGTKVSGSTMCRVLKRHGYTRKKAGQLAQHQYVEFRVAFIAQVLQFKSECFVWVDETK